MRKKTNFGMSLVEVMLAAGLLGGISLGVMKLMTTMNKQTSNLNSKTQELQLFQSINNTLLDEKACTNVLAGKTLTDTLNSIQTKSNTTLYNIDATAQNAVYNFVRIKSATLNNHQFAGCSSYPCSSTVDIDFIFEKTKKIETGNKLHKRTITITATIGSAGGTVTSCYGDISAATATSKDESCKAIGGTFDPTNNKCDLSASVFDPSSTTNALSHKQAQDNFVLKSEYTPIPPCNSGYELAFNVDNKLSCRKTSIRFHMKRRMLTTRAGENKSFSLWNSASDWPIIDGHKYVSHHCAIQGHSHRNTVNKHVSEYICTVDVSTNINDPYKYIYTLRTKLTVPGGVSSFLLQSSCKAMCIAQYIQYKWE